MRKKQRKFADDGWAIWIEGDDTSTVYINDWLNPKGKSFVDLAVRIQGVKVSKHLHVYVPFSISIEEIEDISLQYKNEKILQAIFSTSCVVDFKKNKHCSEIAYNGKTVDLIHISTLDFNVSPLQDGTIISVDLAKLQPYFDNDEAYITWRMPHKSLDSIFKTRANMGKILERIRDLITTPIISEKYGYSVRINESRLLPKEIAKKRAFHSQKLKKASVTISIDESYELNDTGCYRISRLEEDLYKEFLPKGYKSENVITYQWHQNRDYNLKGHFNFYYNIAKNSVSRGSMFFYIVLLLGVGVVGDIIADWVITLLDKI